jgi:hypothetical protein
MADLHQVPKILCGCVMPHRIELWPHIEQDRHWKAVIAAVLWINANPHDSGKLLHRAEVELKKLHQMDGVKLPDRSTERNHIEQGDLMHSDHPDVLDTGALARAQQSAS